MTLGEKIFRLRTEQGLSQETFGEKLGVSRQSVCVYAGLLKYSCLNKFCEPWVFTSQIPHISPPSPPGNPFRAR